MAFYGTRGFQEISVLRNVVGVRPHTAIFSAYDSEVFFRAPVGRLSGWRPNNGWILLAEEVSQNNRLGYGSSERNQSFPPRGSNRMLTSEDFVEKPITGRKTADVILHGDTWRDGFSAYPCGDVGGAC